MVKSRKNWEIKILKPKAFGGKIAKGTYEVISLLSFTRLTYEEILEKLEEPMARIKEIEGPDVFARLYIVERELFETVGGK